MTRRPFRVDPKLPVAAMKTYEIRAPRSTHFRAATCAEVNCPVHRLGWRTVVDEATELGQRQAHYIRREAGRAYREERQPDGLTAFTFESGQRCFTPHQVRVGQPELYVVRGGDHRGNPTGETRQHSRAADWVDEFANHQISLAETSEKG